MASGSCDNISGRNVTYDTDIRPAINEQRYNNISSHSIRICSQFEKPHPRSVQRIKFPGLETY